jgi:hypothetical protein
MIRSLFHHVPSVYQFFTAVILSRVLIKIILSLISLHVELFLQKKKEMKKVITERMTPARVESHSRDMPIHTIIFLCFVKVNSLEPRFVQYTDVMCNRRAIYVHMYF